MYSVTLLKRVVDVIYEEISHPDYKPEPDSSDKDKIIEELYRMNIQLENKLRLYEKDFEVFTALHPTVATSSNVPEDQSDVPQPQEKKQSRPEIKLPVKNTVVNDHSTDKRDRREYMRDYHKNYRKKQREKKIEVTL